MLLRKRAVVCCVQFYSNIWVFFFHYYHLSSYIYTSNIIEISLFLITIFFRARGDGIFPSLY